MALNLDRVDSRKLDVFASYPAAPSSSDPLVSGFRPGVALEDENADSVSQLLGQTPTDFGGVYRLTVVGSNDAGNSAIKGLDLVYYHPADGSISKIVAGGIPYGQVHGDPSATLVEGGASGSVPVALGVGFPMSPIVEFPVFVAGAAVVQVDVVLPFAGKLVDAWIFQTDVGEASDTLQIKKSTTALTDAMAWSDTSAPFNVVRPATLVAASIDFAKGDTLRIDVSDDDSGDDAAPGWVICKFLLL